MSNISIKKNFKNGDKLYDVELNNNFMVIEAGINANEENLEQVIVEAETRLETVFETESEATEARIAANNQQTAQTIAANNQQTAQTIAANNQQTAQTIASDNLATKNAIIADNNETAAEIEANNEATLAEIRRLVVNEGWDWGGTTTERVRFFKGNTSQVSSQNIINGQLLFDFESGIISLDESNSRKMLGGALWDETPKKPVKYKRKTTVEIASLPIEDGSVIYNTDNGKQFMDIGNQRIPTGGAGGEVVLDESDITEDTKLVIEDEDFDFEGLPIKNEKDNSTDATYSCNFVNSYVGDLIKTQEFTRTISQNANVVDYWTLSPALQIPTGYTLLGLLAGTAPGVQAVIAFNYNGTMVYAKVHTGSDAISNQLVSCKAIFIREG